MRAWAASAAVLVAISAPAARAAPAVALDVGGGALGPALTELARQARVELLFDRDLVRGRTAPAVRGQMTAEAGFSRLLAGSGLGYRVTPEGAFVLYPLEAASDPAPAGRDGAIAELLVVGRRTQNVDIRRSEVDIQPYRILGRRDIEASGRSELDEVLRARESANVRAGSPGLFGETRSSVDLRGLGEDSTLVLVDGRRMPYVPSASGEFDQADLNGVPLGAIERVEVLTTAAGGIHGPGAVGGVINVVLRRDYRGADVTAQVGTSDRGDAREVRVEGRLGFTPDGGRTDVMLLLATSRAEPLRAGRRDYLERAGRRAFANDPEGYLESLPIRNGVAVASAGGPLTLDPAWGGAALGSRYTFLPIGFTGGREAAAALLVANAGRLPFDLSDDATGADADIAMAPQRTSGLVNVRRELTPGWELFVDALASRNRGHQVGAFPPPSYRLGADNLGNPFGQTIILSFPQPVLRSDNSYGLDSGRATIGVIGTLPRAWKMSADYTVSRAALRSRLDIVNTGISQAISGRPRPGAPAVDPFGDWASAVAALPAYSEATIWSYLRLRGRGRDFTVRLAGPLASLPGGPLTATLLAEDRKDQVDASQNIFFGGVAPIPARVRTLRSAYAELRAPLVDPGAAGPLRGLEVQAAVRYDRSVQRSAPASILEVPVESFSATSDAVTYTVGARVSPIEALMLRGSIATGERLPTFSELQPTVVQAFGDGLPDPRRGGRPLGSEGPFFISGGGSPDLGSPRARSVTVGFVLNPHGGPRPRLSVDYSRIVVSREAARLPLSFDELFLAEAQYPERVVRRPATAADLANGFSVGPVVRLDLGPTSTGRTVVEAVDARLDWRLPPSRYGDVRLYGAATWLPKSGLNRSFPALDDRLDPRAPVEWRGNAGVEWVRGPMAVDLNAQYFGRQSILRRDFSDAANEDEVIRQGARHVPAQTYVDLHVRRRIELAGAAVEGLEARLSVQNLFDRRPPTLATSELGFSEYGDPRRRRLSLALSARF